MRAAVLTAGLFGTVRPAKVAPKATVEAKVRSLQRTGAWDADRFAAEQTRGLVRQVFFTSASPPVRQVVFSAVDSETDLCSICRRVGDALAAETTKDIAILASDPEIRPQVPRDRNAGLRSGATKMRSNLWLLPLDESGRNELNLDSLDTYLAEIRREFDFSIIAPSPAAGVSAAVSVGRFADGVVLVLSALRTRRASARQFRDALSGAPLLGAVLSDREFPIPEGIYRRL
jgi:hypothetical protein